MLARICRLVVVAVAMQALTTSLEAQPLVPARQPLTYQDSGIYGWMQPYFWEGPFDFVITQAILADGTYSPPGTNNASDLEHIKIWNESLLKIRAAGKRVLVVISPGQGRVYSEADFVKLDQFLANVSRDELYAISLSEENVSSAEWIAALNAGYRRVKAKYPDLPVYQWYTCSSRADARPGFTWPLLLSDGWLADEYVAAPSDFEQAVRRYRMLGKPFVNIIWASPSTSVVETSVQYHDSIFDGQVRVSEKYAVPTAFYCWDGDVGGRTWAWDPKGPPANRELFKRILKIASDADQLPEAALNDWDHAEIPVPTVLNKRDDGTFLYRESFDLWDGLPDSPRPPAHDFMERSDIRGLRQMTCPQDPNRLLVSGAGEKKVAGSVINHWKAPGGESLRFTASANVIIEPAAGAEVIFEVSPSGYDWEQRTVAKESRELKIEFSEPQSELHTRLRIHGQAQSGKPIAAIDWIEVRGTSAK